MKPKRPIFEKFTETFGWLLIVCSPFLLGLAVGIFCYYYIDGFAGMAIGILFALTGLVVGILWANKKLKGKATTHYISQIMSTPELDKPGE